MTTTERREMKYTTNPKDSFGHQCDALTKSGERCRCTNRIVYPAYIRQGVTGRDVRLCHGHAAKRERLKWDRIPLIEGGFAGGYNKYGYGTMVTTVREIDWEDPDLILEMPQYWADATQPNTDGAK